MTQKLLLLATVVSLSGATAFMPMVAHGDTLSDLMAQIASLQAQLLALQGSSSSSSAVSSVLLSSGDLTLGSKGAAVMELQKFLNANGAQVAASGAGSPGNESSYFGGLTKAALAKWQATNNVSPAAGYFGALTRAKMASVGGTTTTTTTGGTAPATAPAPEEISVVAPAPAPVVVAVPEVTLPNPFESTLKIETTFNSTTLSSYGEKTLAVFQLSSDEKIGITKIRFINKGTFRNSYITNFKLLANSDTGQVIAETSGSADGTVEFNINSDNTKADKGLIVSGNTYYLRGYLLVPAYGGEKPYVRMDIDSAGDISAYDYNDLNRVATITKNNTFPIRGPQITAF